MQAKIYKPAKTAMQSGRAKYNKWILKISDSKNQTKDTMMGWNGGSNTSSQIQLQFKTKNPLVLVAEAPEKPGNIGALLRTADAANVDAVIIANPKTDLYNPNIVRSSVGCVFSNTIATGSTEDVISFLNTNNINIYSAILQESINCTHPDYKTASAIVVGTEATGLSQEWRDASKENISIPMQGKIDSMNVSVAAGILVFEAVRQRSF